MAVKLTHPEFDRRVEEAMKPQTGGNGGGNFAPGLQQLRKAASRRRQLTPQRPVSAS